MKKDTQGRAQNSAAKNKIQTQTTAANGPSQPQGQPTGAGEVPEIYRVMFQGETLSAIDQAAAAIGRDRDQFILEAVQGWITAVEESKGATLKPETEGETAAGAAALAAAEPYYQGKSLHVPEGKNLHTTIEPNLSLWAARTISRADCLHYICRAVSDNETALREHAVPFWRGVTGDMVLAGEFLALLSVAKGIAGDGKMGKGCTDEELSELRATFAGLPGLLGLRGAPVDEVLYELSQFLNQAQTVIEEKIIGPMADRRKALELTEAMVLAEELAACAGYATDFDGPEFKQTRSTRLIRLARQVLLEAMQADDMKAA